MIPFTLIYFPFWICFYPKNSLINHFRSFFRYFSKENQTGRDQFLIDVWFFSHPPCTCAFTSPYFSLYESIIMIDAMTLGFIFNDINHKDVLRNILSFHIQNQKDFVVLRLLCKYTNETINEMGYELRRKIDIGSRCDQILAVVEKRIGDIFSIIANEPDTYVWFSVEHNGNCTTDCKKCTFGIPICGKFKWWFQENTFIFSSKRPRISHSVSKHRNENENLFISIVLDSDCGCDYIPRNRFIKRVKTFLNHTNSIHFISMYVETRDSLWYLRIRDLLPKGMDFDLFWLYKFIDNVIKPGV